MRHHLLFLGLLTLAACYEAPEFPLEPQIEFEDVSFVVSKDPTIAADTLKITIAFRDGDSDLGLSGDEVEPPYDFFTVKTNPLTKRPIKLGEFDTLPPYNCDNYAVGEILKQVVNNNSKDTLYYFNPFSNNAVDTVYGKQNELYYNFFVDLYTVTNGQEKLFDFREEFGVDCAFSLNGRFPKKMENLNGSVSGSITRRIESPLLLPFLSNDSLKLKVRIADRAGHISNQVESPVFTLRGIQTNR